MLHDRWAGSTVGGLKGMSIATLKAKGISGETPQSGIYSVTVPGAVARWDALHERFGNPSLSEDLQPAIGIAENGVPVTETNAENWREFVPLRKRNPIPEHLRRDLSTEANAGEPMRIVTQRIARCPWSSTRILRRR